MPAAIPAATSPRFPRFNAPVQLLLASTRDAAKLGQPLFFAVRNGHVAAVRLLVDAGADVNARTLMHGTILHEAVFAREPEVVHMLVDARADLDVQDQYGYMPLVHSMFGDGDIAEVLIRAGANVNRGGNCGTTPVHLAASEFGLCLQLLLSAKGVVTHREHKQGLTPLHLAAGRQGACCVPALLQAHADVNAESFHGVQPLRIAAEMNDLAALRVLLEAKANVDGVTGHVPPGGRRRTALAVAYERKNWEVVQTLMCAGATIAGPEGAAQFGSIAGQDPERAAERVRAALELGVACAQAKAGAT